MFSLFNEIVSTKIYIWCIPTCTCDSLLIEIQIILLKYQKLWSEIHLCGVFMPDLLTCSMLHWGALIILQQMQMRRRYGFIYIEVWSNVWYLIQPKYGRKTVSGDELHSSASTSGHSCCISLQKRSSERDLCIACSVGVTVKKSHRNPISYLNSLILDIRTNEEAVAPQSQGCC